MQFPSPTPYHEVTDRLSSLPDVEANPAITIDGESTVRCDLLQVEMRRDTFDRSGHSSPPSVPHEVIGIAFHVAAAVCERLRIAGRTAQIRDVQHDTCFWRCDFLADDGADLIAEPTKFLALAGAPVAIRLMALTTSVWNHVASMPADAVIHDWEHLLLDAGAVLPHVGAAVSLANAALEAVIASRLNLLNSKTDPKLWQWVITRDWLKAPSVDEQFDALSELLAGRSLKESPELWQAFKRLPACAKLTRSRGQSPDRWA